MRLFTHVGRVEAGVIHYYARSPAGAELAVVQVLLTDMFTHSGFYLAVSEQSPSTAMSVLETVVSFSVEDGRFLVRHKFANFSGGCQAGVVGQDGWYLLRQDRSEEGMDRSTYLTSRRL
jgi:hypothetical protein